MDKIKKIVNSNIFPFIVLFMIMLSFSIFKNTNINDDVYFSEVLLDGKGPLPEITTMAGFLGYRYNKWTSRIIIEFFLVLFAKNHTMGIIWKVLDSLVYAIMAYSIERVFIGKKDDRGLKWIIILLVLLIPNYMVGEAGYIATGLNYIWPIAFGLVSLIPIRKAIDNEKIKWYEYLIYLPLSIFAVNAELVCACILVIYLIFTIYLLFKKKINPVILLILLISIISMIIIMKCPGNAQRTRVETESRFGDFNNISVIDKFTIGLFSTINWYFFNFNSLYFIFTLIMMITILKKYKNILYRIIGTIPFIMGIIFNVVFPNSNSGYIYRFYIFFLYIEDLSVPINFGNFNIITTYIPIIINVLVAGFLFISLYLTFGNTKKTLISILAFGAGVCSKLIMGFMPTVYASGARTNLIFLVMLISLIVMMLEKIDKKYKYMLLNLLIIFAVLFK